jgi:deoxyribonuclease IV
VAGAERSFQDLVDAGGFQRRHIGPSVGERERMLDALGLSSITELLDRAVPAPIRDDAPLDLPAAASEAEVLTRLRALADRNVVRRSLIGAEGVIVHGGHVGADDDVEVGYGHWRSTLERLETTVPILIENTAGGDNAIARHFDRIGRLWETLDGVETPFGLCLDTCHTHAGGEDVAGSVQRIRALTGRIDLVHLNDSKDDRGSGRDRHQNLGKGRIDLAALVEVVQQAGADVVLETPEPEGGEHAGEIAFIRGQVEDA